MNRMQNHLTDVQQDGLAQARTEDRRSALAQVRGMWKERTDLPDFAGLRREVDRRVPT